MTDLEQIKKYCTERQSRLLVEIASNKEKGFSILELRFAFNEIDNLLDQIKQIEDSKNGY